MRSSTRRIRDLAVFAILASVILVSQIVMAGIPGVQLVGMLIATLTVTYRVRALIPIYVFVLLFLVYYGFGVWNLAYLYIWLPLWGVFMLGGKVKCKKIRIPLFAFLCGLFGLSFGVLYAPFTALTMGLNFEQTVIWVKVGLFLPPYVDFTHAASNFAAGFLIVPLSELLTKLDKE
jgi:energy-coupling factor transport system substrate-specific component